MTPERLYELLTKYAESQGVELNSDKPNVMDIMRELLKNEERYGYRSCPCRLAKGIKESDQDIICPCVYMRPDVAEYGGCYCGLYVSREWNSGMIKHVRVPERRPMEKR